MADRARSPDAHHHKKDKKDKKDHKEHKEHKEHKHKKHGDSEHHSSSKHHKHHHHDDKARRSRSRSPPRGQDLPRSMHALNISGRSRSRTPPARGERRDVFTGPLPELFSIHHGKVTRIEGFGAFVQLDGFSKQGAMIMMMMMMMMMMMICVLL